LAIRQRTQDVIRDGWYVTGDIAIIDDSGFIRITDRLSRFSKIGGEMVPHMKVEEQILALLEEGQSCVVTAVPDETKGERLVAFLYRRAARTGGAVGTTVSHRPAAALAAETRGSAAVERHPDAGTGKVDLRTVRERAMEAV
jgi:acyl-[acyl-carrier-protein]-phospholipid O-acyltransferase/long-chain-fatty-acid--[acyl-carrier-protein] ligase